MSITVRFCGAARTVTGSCYLFHSSAGRLLVDCGLFQGSKTLKALNYGAFPFRPSEIDVVLLTHAHIDHSGLLPKLVREGFHGRIFATRGTMDLCSYLLPDSGYIQESEVAALNKRNSARGRAEVTPIYTQADAVGAEAETTAEDLFGFDLPTNDNSPNLLKTRHTTAHIMAMAVQRLYPEAQVTIGPWIDQG